MAFGIILIVALVIAFFVNFYNFQSRTKREIAGYQDQVQDAMDRVKKAQTAQEDAEAEVHRQTYIMSQSEEQIRNLEDRLIDLESLAERAEALVERYRRLE